MEPNSKRIAAIDIGTNSAHLVIASINENGHLAIFDTDKVLLRLGEAFDEHKNIKREAIERTAKAVLHMKELGKSYDPAYRIVATHAVREAQNQMEFIDFIKNKTGITVEVIDGLEEARLISVGMQAGFSFPPHEPFLGMDIGGGSTEVIVSNQEKIQYVSSAKLGAVVLTKQYLSKPTISISDIEQLQEHVETRLGSFQSETRNLLFHKALACSGTAKSLAQMHAKLFRASDLSDTNGYKIPVDDVMKIYRELTLLKTPKKIRQAFPVDQARSEIILAGTTILLGYSNILKVKEWVVSTYGLREGLVLDTASRIAPVNNYSNEDVRWNNVKSLAKKLRINSLHAEKVTLTAQSIYDQLEDLPKSFAQRKTYLSDRELLSVASWLHESGKFIAFPRYHKHSFYIISNSRIMGFTQEEKEIIGLIARYHRKGVASRKSFSCRNLHQDDLERVNFLAAILRISVAINRTRQYRIKDTIITLAGRKIIFTLEHDENDSIEVELHKIENEKQILERIFDFEISIKEKKVKYG